MYGRLPVDEHLDLALLGTYDDGLFPHPPNHVEWRTRLPTQRQLQSVFLDALLNDLAQLPRDLEEPIRRAQSTKSLMGPLVVVVLHPETNPLAGLLKAIKHGSFQELLPEALPKPFDLAQSHRMMGPTLDVVDPVLLQLVLELGFAPPVGVLTTVVGEHFLGHAILADGSAIDFHHLLGTLAAKQIHSDYVARIVIEEADQVCILTANTKHEDVRLPQLIGRGPLEALRLGRVVPPLVLRPLDRLPCVQRAAHRLGAGGQETDPPQELADLLHAKGGMLPLQRDDLLFDRRGDLGRSRGR